MQHDSSGRAIRPTRSMATALRGLDTFIADDRVRRAAITAFLIVQLTFMAIQSIPPKFFLVTAFSGENLMTSVKDKVTAYASHVGLFQTWAMFAPNPGRQNTYIDAEIIYRNGKKHLWTFPQMQELGYAERYAKERYRKFANERLWLKERSELWPDAARYIARLNADASNPPQIVRLAHYWSEIPPPPLPDETPRPERWNRNIFFTYTVKPGDLL